MFDEENTVVIDNGSSMIKAGFAGEEAPRAVFPSIIGRPRHASAMQGGSKDYFIGDEAIWKRALLNFNYPIKCHSIDWEEMEKIWEHTFQNEIRVEPDECNGVVLVDSFQKPQIREKMVEIMFEKFNFYRTYVDFAPKMTLYAYGRTTGLACDAGDIFTQIVPYFEGYPIPHANQRMSFSGRRLTNWMQQICKKFGENFTSSFLEMTIVKDIKEKCTFVAQKNWENSEPEPQDVGSKNEIKYTLPDKRVFTIPVRQRFECPELLFDPELDDLFFYQSIQDLCVQSINSCDMGIRKDIQKNILLSGGTTMFEGFADRLKDEVAARLPEGSEVRVNAQGDRKFAVWKGASTLASLSTFESSWIDRYDYEEHGSYIVNKKCPCI